MPKRSTSAPISVATADTIGAPSGTSSGPPAALPRTIGTYCRAVARRLRRDWTGALDDLETALRMCPGSSLALCYRGLMRLELGRLDEAIADYDQVLAIDPKNFDAAHNRGVCFERQQDLRGAWAAYTQALGIRPDSAHAYHSRGNICRDLGDLEGAAADYGSSLIRDPANGSVALKRGQALLAMRRADEAYREFTRAAELDPACADAFMGRADVWRLRGDSAGVRRNLEAALKVATRRWPRRAAAQAELNAYRRW